MSLADAPLFASLPAEDLDRAKRWYEEKLGLTPTTDLGPGGLLYASAGSQLLIYPTKFAGTAKHTLGGWVVPDLDAKMRELRDRGVTFEEYSGEDGPKTENGVNRDPDGGASAWFKDSEGSILALTELPAGMTFPGSPS
jgi:catechol 2,3-dioxygenase-like lactoylglutathione lyase family enzyme